jgi:fructose-bisphosphate aldolase, class II
MSRLVCVRHTLTNALPLSLCSFSRVAYKPGNVKLAPERLGLHQKYIKEKHDTDSDTPALLVFHGGSGSLKSEIELALSFGVVKMNIDSDTQWAYWKGVNDYATKKHDYLQSQVGNPDGEDKPNKKHYDPRVWIRAAETEFKIRLTEACKDLKCAGML